MARIDSFFKFMKEQSASDLHLSTGNTPMLRIHGELVRVDTPPIDNDDLKALVYEIAPEQKIKLFEETAGCALCHAVNGKGGQIGPELTGIGTKYARATLIESVLYPSKQIFDGYRSTVIMTKGGDTLTGFIRDETPAELVVLDAAGEKHPLKKDQITKREESNRSFYGLEHSFDNWRADPGADGKFEFTGVPGETVSIFLMLKPFDMVSPRNISSDGKGFHG